MGGGHERRRPVLLFTCATTRRFAKQLQCPAQALLKRPLSAGAGPHAVNRFTRVARSKPEPAKRLENPRPKARHPRARRLAIVRAIGMLKAKTRSKLTASPPWGRSSSRCASQLACVEPSRARARRRSRSAASRNTASVSGRTSKWRACFWAFPIVGFGSAWEGAHHPFDFAERAAVRSGEPLAFGLRCGNAGELTHCGPVECPVSRAWASAGKSWRARATRRRSSVTRGVWPSTRSEYSAKLAMPSSRFACVR